MRASISGSFIEEFFTLIYCRLFESVTRAVTMQLLWRDNHMDEIITCRQVF
ncbi:hypothetical protein KS4_34440 [Poriferisphaera corsica]|uniref:Uncharacterized protein n=1 Tax=Poriferisphaera corsica TaxID=2528020 RepID=A0A517YYR1_9BACT|nr:hypothetical protein KS4_34440 [Poriferisphaera corsica]